MDRRGGCLSLCSELGEVWVSPDIINFAYAFLKTRTLTVDIYPRQGDYFKLTLLGDKV